MTVKTLLLAGGTLLSSATAALASGFQVNLGGQQNIGMGGVGVGLSLDQAAMFYNPGALAMVRENGVQVGANFAIARGAFMSENGGAQRDLQHLVVTPFNLYAGFGPKDGKYKFGVAVYTPYGSQLRYADRWEGRYALTEINLQSVYVQPTFSYAFSPRFSVGVGLMMLAYGAANIQRDLPLPTGPAHLTLDGKAKFQMGFNAGLFFKPSNKLSVGLAYRSQIDARLETGTVNVSGLPAAGSPSAGAINSQFTATSFSSTLPLPAMASIGIGVTPTDKLTLGLDASLVLWNAYRTLDFAFSGNNGNAGPATDANTGLVGGKNTSSSKRSYQDALAFRAGGQYKATDQLFLRLGAAYDFSAVKDGYVTPETPDADRVIGTAGITYQPTPHLGIDASFQFEHFQKRTQTQSDLLNNGTTDRVAGTYRTDIFIPGIGVRYSF